MRSYKSLIYVFVLTATILPFQNCGSKLELQDPSINGAPVGLPSTAAPDELFSEADLALTFSTTLQPTLRNNCAGCHGAFQNPMFAVESAEAAVATIMSEELVDFNNPANSFFVIKIQSGHNGFSPALASQIQSRITEWAAALATAAPQDPEQPGLPGEQDPTEPVTPMPPPRDTEPPTVMITSPNQGAILQGTVSLSALAADNVGVAGVQFYLDEVKVGSPDLSAPYSVSLNTATMPNGMYNVTAEAWDAEGNLTVSSAVTVDIDNAQEPVGNPLATYTWISTNVLGPRCIACHGSRRNEAGIRYDSYVETLRSVLAGDPIRSKLYTEVNSGSMPQSGSKLSATQIQAIRDWIEAGALNN